MFNKALFWIFVWFLKTWKKSSPLSEIYLIVIYFDSFTFKSLLFIFPFECLPHRDSGAHSSSKILLKQQKFLFSCIAFFMVFRL